MSIITETKPHREDWIQLEQERILREKLGDKLYQWLELKESEGKNEN